MKSWFKSIADGFSSIAEGFSNFNLFPDTKPPKLGSFKDDDKALRKDWRSMGNWNDINKQ